MNAATNKEYNFDFRRWRSVFPLRRTRASYRAEFGISEEDFFPGVWPIAGPFDLVIFEQLRREMRSSLDRLTRVPTDVFVWAKGEPGARDVTKVGGLPYRPSGKPWPTLPDGEPYTFVGQLRFTESKDIVGEVPADVLLVFGKDDVGATEDFHFEWQPGGVDQLVNQAEIPVSAWSIPIFFGVRHRSVDYIDPKGLFSYEDDEEVVSKSRFFGTKIGGAPCWIQTDDQPAAGHRFLASLGPILPDPVCPFPWANSHDPAPIKIFGKAEEDDRLMWGDAGSLYLMINGLGDVYGKVQCF